MQKLYRKFFAAFFFVSLVWIGADAQAPTQHAPEEDFVRSHYTKYEFRIRMRDDVRLFTAVYVPKPEAFADHGPYPFLITRTPYSAAPYGEDKYPLHLGPSDEFEKGGYIFVTQDVRGRWMSEGEFVEMRPHIDQKKSPKDIDDASDMYDTLEFLLKHVGNNNGKAGIWGISYPGFYTAASIIDSHPALVAASPQAPMNNLFLGDDSYHNGAFKLSATYGFYQFFVPQHNPIDHEQRSNFDFGTSDSYRFYLESGNLANLSQKMKTSTKLWEDQFRHDTYGSYWQARDLELHMKNIKCAVLVVGGWFDAEDLAGPFQLYKAIRKFNPATPVTLVEGPWVHGGWMRSPGDHLGDVQFASKTSEFFHRQVQFPFFEHYLKGKGSAQPAAVAFETGTNVWRKLESWPPQKAISKTLYFHADGKLSLMPPTELSSKDEYLSDPAHPVPFVGYITDTVPQRFMVDDQRFASQRPDVVTYQSEPLEEDLTIAGPLTPHLKVASTGTDADFVVKLIDVYPDDYPDPSDVSHGNKRVLDAPPLHMGGYQQLLRGEPFRAKFRASWGKPEPVIPGKLTPIDFTMPDLYHTFRRGHRIMVQVQSSWFPLVDRNPQTFTDIPFAKPEEFKKATETIFHQKDAASGVEVQVLPQP